MEITEELIITELVVNGGNARGLAIEAIKAARNRDFDRAKEKLTECEEALTKAHQVHTGILQAEARERRGGEVSLLMVHAQDHLMNAITVRELAVQMIEMYKVIYMKAGET